MKRRGRPRAPGLTPRETQVLALIREGRSNREIAEKLGISLQGVKYHVTEILGKLGVDSREEAARWEAQPGRRRWGFAPFASRLSWADGAVAIVTPKLVAPPIAGLLVLGIVFGGILTRGEENTAVPEAALAEPTATLEMPPICEQTECMFARDIRTEVSSLEEAAAIATFQPRLPAYIPEGFGESRMMHTRSGPMTTIRADGTREERPFAADPYYDTVWALYTNAAGDRLTVQQGYYHVAPTGWWDIAPEGMRGSVELRATELRWIKGGPKPTTEWEPNSHGGFRPVQSGWDDGGYILYWTTGSIEIDAWEVSPDGQRSNVNLAFEYEISSDSLPLEELLKVAASLITD